MRVFEMAPRIGDFVALVVDYHGGGFGAISLLKVDNRWHILFIPVHRRGGPPPALGMVELADDKASRVWALLDAAKWQRWPRYVNYRRSDETSPAPYYFLVRRGGVGRFCCVAYGYHQQRYKAVVDVLIAITGIDAFYGEHRTLAPVLRENASP